MAMRPIPTRLLTGRLLTGDATADRPTADLPPNVIPLRAAGITPEADRSSELAGAPQDKRLVEADPDNPAHQPTPIFGRATVNLPQWPLVLVFAAVFISLGVVVVDSFRIGSIMFGASMLLAFFLRLVLTDREAGMLKVRSRVVDLVVLGAFAASMLLVSLAVPVQA